MLKCDGINKMTKKKNERWKKKIVLIKHSKYSGSAQFANENVNYQELPQKIYSRNSREASEKDLNIQVFAVFSSFAKQKSSQLYINKIIM